MPQTPAADARPHDQLRPTTIEPFPTAAAAGVLITAGQTRVLCTASIASEPPRWIPRDEDGNPERGWVTAEYNMLPGSTPDRKRRGPDSRGTEIQRLIGRSLRAAVDLTKMPGLAITCDCDVLHADGGTRTASITGAWVALAAALHRSDVPGVADALLGPVTAVSVGVCDGRPTLDLDYPLDSTADVDLNVVMNHDDRLVELQGTGENATFARNELDALLDLATAGIRSLRGTQVAALGTLQ
jgi:ribonuclease PH